MHGLNYIALAIPVFFVLMGVEYAASRWLEKDVYRLNDSLADLHTGVFQQVLGIFFKTVVFGAYVAVWDRWRLLELSPASAWVWVLCALAVDHQYYWFHRVSHECNLPWGAHIVHHSSEEYNLSVALRQSALQPLFSWIFYLPLAWMGFPPLVFFANASLNTLYQFWIHTRLIGKLGPLEAVLNTPSHHRVHHGCDEKYIDKNYAGVLIVFDRLYGSFQPEEEEPTYGVTKPVASWNPVTAHVHHFVEVLRMGRRAPSPGEWLKMWWKPPGWKPAWAPEGAGALPLVSPLSHGAAGKYDARPPWGLAAYGLVQFFLVIAATLLLLFREGELASWQRVGLALWILWTCTNLGGLFDRRAWVLPGEMARLAAGPVFATAWLAGSRSELVAWVILAGMLSFGAAGAWLLSYRAALDRRGSARAARLESTAGG